MQLGAVEGRYPALGGRRDTISPELPARGKAQSSSGSTAGGKAIDRIRSPYIFVSGPKKLLARIKCQCGDRCRQSAKARRGQRYAGNLWWVGGDTGVSPCPRQPGVDILLFHHSITPSSQHANARARAPCRAKSWVKGPLQGKAKASISIPRPNLRPFSSILIILRSIPC